MTNPDEIARCAAVRRARRAMLHCGVCGRPFVSKIGAPECDCAPRMDVLGMSTAVEAFQQASAVAAPVFQEAVRNMSGAPAPEVERVPPSGWRERSSLL